MGYHKRIPLNDLSCIEALIKNSVLGADVKRLQYVYLRGRGYSVEHIAALTQFSIGHIRRIWSAYFTTGIDALVTKPRGGRRHYLLDEQAEQALLAQHAQAGSEGLIVEIDALHKSLCERVGKEVAL